MPSLPLGPPSSRPSTIPLPIWQPSTRIARFNFGASSSPKSRSLSTSYGPRGWIQRSQHTRRSMARNSTGIEHPLHPSGRGPLASYLPRSGTRSNPMISTHGMSVHPSSTTARCTSITRRRDTARAAGRTSCSQHTLVCHPSPKPTTQSSRQQISWKCSRKLYQLVQLRNETIAKFCAHSPVSFPSTKRRDKAGGRPNERKQYHPKGWAQHRIRG